MSGSEGFPQIPLFDLQLEPEDLEAVAQALRSGWLAPGPRTEAFERAFAEHLGCAHGVAVSSCTAALHLAYLAAGVGPGDEVIVPSITFAATAAAVVYAGGTPVFADIIGPEDPSLDPQDVADRITPRTKAVGVVHMAGYPAPVRELRALCDEHGLALIEDVAHAPDAAVDGRRLGTFGLAGAFSFFSNKVLSVGEGGLLATDDDRVAALARRLRDHALSSSAWERSQATEPAGYDVSELGFNYRWDEPRAALLLSRMGRLERDVARRRELSLAYRRALADVPGVVLPYTDDAVMRSSCYVMPIVLEDLDKQGPLRIALRERHGVQTSLLYPSVHEFTAYRERWPGISLPRSERWSRTEVTIPLFPHMTEEQQGRVVAAIRTELAALDGGA